MNKLKKEMQKTMFLLDKNMHQRLKIFSVKSNISMAEAIRRAVSEYLERENSVS